MAAMNWRLNCLSPSVILIVPRVFLGDFMRTIRLALAVVLMLALGSMGRSAFADNLLSNGSFQSGDLTGWNLNPPDEGNTGVTNVLPDDPPFTSYTGEDADGFYAFLGAIDSDTVLSQTVSDSSGQAYTVSFWFNADGSGPSDFSAAWDGTTLLSLTDALTNGWTLYSFNVTGTGSDNLSFAAHNEPWYDALDNVAVFATTPEPGTLALLGLGLTALIGISRRRVRA